MKVIPTSAMTALMLVATAACGGGGGSDSSAPTTFDVAGLVGGQPDRSIPNESCDYAAGTIAAGDPVVLRGADGSILAKSELEFQQESPYGCAFVFTLEGVPSESGYSLTISDFEDELVVSESELRAPQLRISAASSVASAIGEPDFRVE